MAINGPFRLHPGPISWSSKSGSDLSKRSVSRPASATSWQLAATVVGGAAAALFDGDCGTVVLEFTAWGVVYSRIRTLVLERPEIGHGQAPVDDPLCRFSPGGFALRVPAGRGQAGRRRPGG